MITCQTHSARSFDDQLIEIQDARTLPAQAVETEVAELLDKHAELKTEAGRQRIVRHGHLPEREIVTGIGAVAVRRLRIQHLNNVAITKTPPSRS